MTLYADFSTCDAEGQFTEGFAIEVEGFSLYGMTGDGLLIDITHTDGEKERVTLRAEPYGDFALGREERVLTVNVVSWPHSPILAKDEFHARVGKGKFLCPKRGHYVDSEDDNASEPTSTLHP